MLSARFLSPATSPKCVCEGREFLQIQRHDEIDIPREPLDVNEAKKSGCTDDRNISGKLLGNPVELAEIP
jgi:hypothetical protein